MRRVGIKRSSSTDIGSWDLPPSKRPRVEKRQRRGGALWSRITATFGGILSSVRGWFHRTPDSISCPPLMSEAHTPSPPHSPSSLPHTPSPPPPPPPPPPPRSQSSLTADHARTPLTPHNTHHPTTARTHLSTSSHQHTSTQHILPSAKSTHHSSGSLWSKSVPGKKTIILCEVHRQHNRSQQNPVPNAASRSSTTPLFSAPFSSWTPTSPPPRTSSGQTPPLGASLGTGSPESIGPRLRGQLFSPSFHTSPTPSILAGPHSVLTRLRSTSSVPFPISTRSSNTAALRATPLHPLPPPLPHSPPLSPHPPTTTAHCDVLQRRKWVESVKADHTHSLTQHHEAVERELRRLAECRESRFRAEDSRVKRLQDSVRNMSLLSNFSLEEEEEEEMAAMSEEQEHKVQSVLAQCSGLEVLSQKFNISIKRTDIGTLAGLNWLNDEVINFYMNLIVERGQSSNSVCRVHAMSSFFYPKLCNVGYSGVRRWTKKVDIFSMDLVLYPIHLGAHWCLAAVDNNRHTLSYYDSLGVSGLSCLNALREYLVAEHTDKKKSDLSLQNWNDVIPEDIPKQRNGSDCGVFTCMYARYLANKVPFTFSQEDMPQIRRHIICELLEQRLF